MKRSILALLLFLMVFSFEISAKPFDLESVPAPLKEWIKWVLHDHQNRACPFVYNDFEKKRCFWPGPLRLHLTDSGGRFSIRWKVYISGSVPLPGDNQYWPRNLKVNNRSMALNEQDNRPFVRLEPGDYLISGDFSWTEMPKRLILPKEIGLIDLTQSGKKVAFPTIGDDGQLWLSAQAGDSALADNIKDNRLSIRAYRRIIDNIPMLMEIRIELDVSGKQRELVLNNFYDNEFVPLTLKSPIPARLEADHGLRIQVRPGKWALTLTLRNALEKKELTLAKIPKPWPQEEIWVFDARPYQRLVEIENSVAVDPTQTTLPEQWKSLPAYKMLQGKTMVLKVIQRGDPKPEPNQLTLHKTLWLDFDGNGYTVKDDISGSMTNGWRLTTIAEMKLGQVNIDGKPQLITLDAKTQEDGIELRKGVVNMTAVSRIDRKMTKFDSSGWRQEFTKVSANLNFPPGWKLFLVTGVDNKADTWVTRWTLLDLFLVLIVAFAIGRLWGKKWTLISLVTLALIWHQTDAPRYVWLSILISIALLRVVSSGRFHRSIKVYRNLSLLALIIIAVPFLVAQIRGALYPQLEKPWQQPYPSPYSPISAKQSAAPSEMSEILESAVEGGRYEQAKPRTKRKLEHYYSTIANQIDPNAKVQTGPGLPQWRWRNVHLIWNGPVSQGQQFSIVLLSPTMNRLLNIARALLLSLLALRMFFSTQSFGRGSLFRRSAISLAFFSVFVQHGINDVNADLPNSKILKELETKLLEPPECLPDCAQIQFLKLIVDRESIHVEAEIHALKTVAIPIPVPTNSWTPSKINFSDQSEATLYRPNRQELRLLINEGLSRVSYSGPLPATDTIKIPLPLSPHRVEFSGDGWSIEGVDRNGRPDAQIRLQRNIGIDQSRHVEKQPPHNLAPFFQFKRTFILGLEWRIENEFDRISPANDAVNVKLPLLDDEAVVTTGLRVKDGWLSVNFAAGEKRVRWNSVIKKRDTIQLTAHQTNEWIETWQINYSPIWHLEYSGIPTVYNRSKTGIWSPQWRPWPGEKVTLVISRPTPVKGRTVTIDDSRIQIKPGNRSTETELILTIRSSQGGQHVIKLPEQSKLLSVAIDNQTKPIRQTGRELNLPLFPGKHLYRVKWREPKPTQTLFKNEPVNVGSLSVNNRINLSLGTDRWILLSGGPSLGPAVLFWGVLAMIIVIAVGLARFAPTPLRFMHWSLLLIGLSQVSVAFGLVVVGWLIALGFRTKLSADTRKTRFNLIQLGLIFLTIVALSILVYAVSQGLLGYPSMQVAGNGSSAYDLNWYSDRIGETLPTVWVVSLPLWIYHILMLCWALWLALALLGWLRWGWDCFSKGGTWRSIELASSNKENAIKKLPG